ncbi:MAG TPA: heparinase II/III family protein [Candidatus Omnitrophota bacterium]|nr:heparinase II/III family protein [Candidatus Omnitrophota bacterium]
MLDAILRKGRQLAEDPVLRRWLLARALGRTPAEPAFTAHRPPYLGDGWSGLPLEHPQASLPVLPAGRPTGSLALTLAGARPTIAPGGEPALVRQRFADLETELSLHRFAWVPLMDADADPRWVGTVWQAWCDAHGNPDQSWAWHPYTAAERAVNLLTFAARHGLPEGAETVLAAHAPAIARGLEWFGDHHTSNHCANNGRGLYLLGLALGLKQATEAGARILLEEGRSIFRPSGVLREASTHYHLLLTRQWASVWLAARRHARPEAAEFGATLRAALAVLPLFDLPGRFPLVGDVSPDCPPDHLFGLLPGRPAQGWTALLDDADRAALLALAGDAAPSAEGWLRADHGPWSGLWHAEPEGWSPMPGHGHQDCGGAEIHFGGVPVFIDPGRGSYARAGEADPFVAGGSHGVLAVDGLDPYPQNRPYYDPAFRMAMAGPALLAPTESGVRLVHHGYARIGLGAVERSWSFAPDRLVIDDWVQGNGRHRVERRLVTGLDARLADDVAILTAADGRRFRLGAEDCACTLAPTVAWAAYGEGRPAQVVTFSADIRLPWRGRITVEVL